MKLKNLVDNRPLVLSLLSHWQYDEDAISILDQFRISANAVYPFYRFGEICLLRFAPVEEKEAESVQAELDFLAYLRGCGFSAPETVPTKNGSELLVIDTDWGRYIAAVFKRVAGKKMESLEYSDSLFKEYGQTLGELHNLSRAYHPSEPLRPSWKKQLSKVESVLRECHAPDKVFDELVQLRAGLNRLSETPETYGLIHYDYELDNVFFSEEQGMFSVIDFDDSIYHWYAMDVIVTMNNIENELPDQHKQSARESFLKGYRQMCSLPEEMLVEGSLFHRYENLIRYSRCLWSVSESYKNEPEWMSDLRAYLKTFVVEYEESLD